MAEQITLTTPVAVGTMSAITWDRLTLHIKDRGVTFQWKDNLGRGFSAHYATPLPIYPVGWSGPVNTVTGAQIISAFNTGNHTVNSMAKKAFIQLQTDGYIAAGSISGTPE